MGGGGGVCGRGSGGVRQLMVRAPAGHSGASRWRTSEPPHSSTKKPANPDSLLYLASNPNHSALPLPLLLSSSLSLSLSFFLSFSLSPCFLPDTSPSFSFLTPLNSVQVHLLFGCVLISHSPPLLSVAGHFVLCSRCLFSE